MLAEDFQDQKAIDLLDLPQGLANDLDRLQPFKPLQDPLSGLGKGPDAGKFLGGRRHDPSGLLTGRQAFHRRLEGRHLVGALPGEALTAKVAVVGSLTIDRLEQIQGLDDGLGTEVEDLLNSG